MAVFPTMIAPASFSRWTGVASASDIGSCAFGANP